jgi:hypothetical protein
MNKAFFFFQMILVIALFLNMYGCGKAKICLHDVKSNFVMDESLAKPLSKNTLINKGVADEKPLNRYAYVNGRPVSFVNPFGLASTNVEKKSCSLLFPSPSDFPEIPNVGVCSYYDRIASEQGCNYHFHAAGICRGELSPWSWAANLLLKICGSFSNFSVTQVKNCVRTCLVTYDHYVRENDSACQLQTKTGICTQLECINAYHHQCFENCGISWRCYGGNYDNFIPRSWFYDD